MTEAIEHGSARSALSRAEWNRIRDQKIQRDRSRGEKSLRDYIKLAWPIVESDQPYISNWHIDVISEYLQAITEGHLQNLIINMPPRHMKSLSVGVFWQTWEWIHNPGLRYMYSSYSDENAIRDTVWSRRLIISPWYQARWGDRYDLAMDQNRKKRFENNHGGFRVAHGVGGGVTGEGGQRIVVDDPNRADEDESPVALESAATWWDGTMSTRVNDPETAVRVIVQQRIHEQDLTGHIEAKMEEGGRRYEKLVLPAEYDPRAKTNFAFLSKKTDALWMPSVDVALLPNKKRDELGMTLSPPGTLAVIDADPRSEEDELLWPRKMSRQALNDLKVDLGRKASGQLNQKPVPAEGDVFKAQYFRYWSHLAGSSTHALVHLDNEDRLVELSGTVFSTTDLAVSLKETADETVISTWMWLADAKVLLWLDMMAGRYEGPDIVPLINQKRVRYEAQFVGIESNGFQMNFVTEARRKGMTAVELKPDKDKRSRAVPAAIMMQSMQIFMPRGAHWIDKTENQLLRFTGGPNDKDDIVDTLSYAAWVVNNLLERPRKKRSRSWTRQNA